MNNKSELNVDDVLRLVLPDKDLDNKFDENFDPILYAFQIFDSEGIGYISTERLTEVFSAFGIREISTSELSVLMRVFFNS
jgi:Ca2+-binding EF-hand superfamily protein